MKRILRIMSVCISLVGVLQAADVKDVKDEKEPTFEQEMEKVWEQHYMPDATQDLIKVLDSYFKTGKTDARVLLKQLVRFLNKRHLFPESYNVLLTVFIQKLIDHKVDFNTPLDEKGNIFLIFLNNLYGIQALIYQAEDLAQENLPPITQEQTPLIKLLTEQGGLNLNYQNNEGTVIFVAIALKLFTDWSSDDVKRFIIPSVEYGADLDKADAQGRTLIMYLISNTDKVERSNLEIILEYFFDNKYRINWFQQDNQQHDLVWYVKNNVSFDEYDKAPLINQLTKYQETDEQYQKEQATKEALQLEEFAADLHKAGLIGSAFTQCKALEDVTGFLGSTRSNMVKELEDSIKKITNALNNLSERLGQAMADDEDTKQLTADIAKLHAERDQLEAQLKKIQAPQTTTTTSSVTTTSSAQEHNQEQQP